MPFQGHMSDDPYAGRHLGDGLSAVIRPNDHVPHQQQQQQSPTASELDVKDAKEFQGLLVDKANGGGIGTGLTSLMNGQNQIPHSEGSFLHLLTTSETSTSPMAAGVDAGGGAPWMAGHGSSVMAAEEGLAVSGDSMIAAAMFHGSGDIHNAAAGGGGGREGNGEGGMGGGEEQGGGDHGTRQNARYKADILRHPLYHQLLAAHVACLRIATPVDQLPNIDAQLEQSQNVVAKYSVLGHQMMTGDDEELDRFMTHFVLLLCSFKEQLQQHVHVHAMEAVIACWELEQALRNLTGVSPGEGTGATMSDDEDDQIDSEANLYGGPDGLDSVGFGPLIPTERERSLMEQVRQELKNELKQGYKEKIVDIREEILRKRRAGKLPRNTTSVLKTWWQSHSKWPYPTEDDKARLVQETGLQLKQINNWFINQRKRKWHSNPSSSSVKIKRRR